MCLIFENVRVSLAQSMSFACQIDFSVVTCLLEDVTGTYKG